MDIIEPEKTILCDRWTYKTRLVNAKWVKEVFSCQRSERHEGNCKYSRKEHPSKR